MKSLKSIPCMAIVLLFWLLWFPAAPAAHAEKSIRIVTTTTDLKSIAEFVGGERVRVSSLARGNQDPHFVEAKPSMMIKAGKADLFIVVGLDLEIGYERLILEGSRNPEIRRGQPGYLDCSKGVMRLEIPSGKVDRSQGDIHPYGNPHYWVDPLNAVVMARNIGERLAKIDPPHAGEYRERVKAFEKRIYRSLYGEKLVQRLGGAVLARMDQEGSLWSYLGDHSLQGDLGGWEGTLAPYRGAEIITYHKSWPYFLNRFGFKEAGTLEPKPGIPPSPGHILSVMEQIKEKQVKVVLMELFYDEKPARLVAEKTGAEVVKVPNSVGGSKEAVDYFSLMDLIVGRIVQALQG